MFFGGDPSEGSASPTNFGGVE